MQTMGFLSSKTPAAASGACSAIVPEHFTHAHAVGQTGCGKTTTFIYPNLHARIKAGHGILLYDFKGKEHMSLKQLAHQEGRLDDVVEIGKPWGAKINLMRLMDRKALDLFIKSVTGMSKDNEYWASAASKLFLSVYDIVALLEKITLQMGDHRIVFEELLHMEEDIDLEEFDYPCTLSFKSIMPICQSEQNVSTFLNHLEQLSEDVQKFFLEMLQCEKEELCSPQSLERYKSLMHLYVQFKQAVAASQVSLASFKKADDTNPKISIIMTLMPLVDIANKEEFNCDGSDILELLNTQKLVCINAKDLSDELLEAITYALFGEFAKRSMLMEPQPLSVFIDEAQRVISSRQDHNLDVLRECKVEMFLAYQNEELMKNKLGENRYTALMKNLTSAFYFSNLAMHQDIDLSSLSPFQCYSSLDNNAKTHTLEPLFLDKTALYEVEALYLNSLNVYQAFGLGQFAKESILLFDGRLFENNRVIVYNLVTQTSSIEEIITPEAMEAVQKELAAFASAIEENIRKKEQMEAFFDACDESEEMEAFIEACNESEDTEQYEEEEEDDDPFDIYEDEDEFEYLAEEEAREESDTTVPDVAAEEPDDIAITLLDLITEEEEKDDDAA